MAGAKSGGSASAGSVFASRVNDGARARSALSVAGFAVAAVLSVFV
ncbi:hypothetical protein [Streptomyces sp. MBT53]|nr:hypothetical protein [Streptomyces sp. MBT53]MBK6015250.1 hypothetical protein [Streptomyces sp. MBT53]